MTDDLQGEVSRLCDLFRAAMYAKLMRPKNVRKGTWLSMTNLEVASRLYDELRELDQAINSVTVDRFDAAWAEAVLYEACDVAAFAAMLADPERKMLRSHTATGEDRVDGSGAPYR